MLNHGINTYKSDTSFSAVKTAAVGIPLFIGAWPCHMAAGYVDTPVLATSFAEAKEKGGYSNEWRNSDFSPKWNLCQAMYSHFKLFGMSPAIFINVFDPSKHTEAMAETSVEVENHIAKLSADVIATDLIVKAGETALSEGTDYEIIYDDGCFIELLKEGAGYEATSLTVSGKTADPSAIKATDIEAAIEKADLCKTVLGIIPDLICAPGYSKLPSVAAVMAAKAPSIGGLFYGKAVCDIDSSATGAPTYDKVLKWKNDNGYTDENMIDAWGIAKVGDYLFDMSVIVCGQIASVDTENGGCPYESPSNKSLSISGLCNEAGEDINLTLAQADIVSTTAGVVTAFNFDGWVLWGNHTACYPASADVAEYFICTNRMHDWINNTFTNTFWSEIDKPMTRVRIDSIVNSFNSWLAGLIHEGKLYGGQIEYIADNNPAASLVGGKIRLDTTFASPVPMQQINMYSEFDVDTLVSSLNG
ncbi:MAG: phage tail protein [Ruminococcaceae bacterium]|nr:phage tail protein [Oscillospiraceae bacterium]